MNYAVEKASLKESNKIIRILSFHWNHVISSVSWD